MNELNNKQGLSRRTMVKGAAWSVPIIAVAAATPMAAASTVSDADLGVAFTGTTLDLRSDLVAGLDNWYNGLSTFDKAAALAAYQALRAALNTVGQVINLGFDYPTQLEVSNVGQSTLSAGESASVALDYGSDVLNVGALNNIANVDALATGNGATATVTATSDLAPGGTLATIPLSYNPITVQVDLAGSDVQAGTATATLSGDGDPNMNTASSSYGLWVDTLDALSGVVSAVTSLVPLPPIEIEIFS